MGRLPGLGRGCRPVGGVGMQAALATVSELVRAGLGRLVRRLGWASGWSVAGGPAACHGAALPVGRQQGWAGAGGQWAGLLWASCAGGCWPVRAGLGKLVGQLGWTGGWLVPNGARFGLALIDGLSYRVEAGVEQPGWGQPPQRSHPSLALTVKSKPPKSARTKEAISFEITGFTKLYSDAMFLRDPMR